MNRVAPPHQMGRGRPGALRARGAPRAGQTLVVALVVLAFLSALLGGMSVGLLAEAQFARNQGRRAAGQYAARSAVEIVCMQLLRDDPRVDALGDVWHREEGKFGTLDEFRTAVQYASNETGGQRPGAVDEERKLNVNRATRAMLRALDAQMSDETAKAIIQGRPYATVEDLASVPGLTLEYLRAPRDGAPAGLLGLLTVYGDGRVNVNTAPAAVLKSLEVLTEEDVAKILARRNGPDGLPETEDDTPFQDVWEVKDHLGLTEEAFARIGPWLSVASAHYTIIASAEPPDEAPLARQVRQVVRRSAAGLEIVRFEALR